MLTVPNERSRRLYVVAFTSDTVKVGRAVNLKQRLAEHRRSAAIHGHAVTRSWASEPHSNFEATEAALIKFCAGRWPAVAKEYFPGADYDAVVRHAESLPFAVTQGPDEDSTARGAREFRNRQLDNFYARVDAHSGRPAEEWPQNLLALAQVFADPVHLPSATVVQLPQQRKAGELA